MLLNSPGLTLPGVELTVVELATVRVSVDPEMICSEEAVTVRLLHCI